MSGNKDSDDDQSPRLQVLRISLLKYNIEISLLYPTFNQGDHNRSAGGERSSPRLMNVNVYILPNSVFCNSAGSFLGSIHNLS